MGTKTEFRRRRLGEILVSKGLISEEQLQQALEIQKQTGSYIGSVLIQQGWVSREDVSTALQEQRRDVRKVSRERLEELSPAMAELIPEPLARRFNVIALDLDGNILIVVMEDPTNVEALDLLAHATQKHIEPIAGEPSDIAEAIDRCYGSTLEGETPYEPATLEEVTLEVEQAEAPLGEEEATTDLIASAEETPVVRFVEALFREAVEKRASDVHLEPGEQNTNIRFRIDGVLHRMLSISKRMHPAVVSRIKILSGLNIAERRLPQDGRCRLKFLEREIDVRVSTLPTVHGEKVVMRLLDKGQVILELEKLGFDSEDLEKFKEALRASYGMILLSGPTGSGKTTTLYAGLSFLNEPSMSIVTVEDPVEYEIPGIAQVQVKPEIELSFARTLRHILRQDPNVIMIGEMRDLETAQIAVRAALTGHLVLSTVHANNAPAVVSRLMEIGTAPYLISATLNLTIAQRLVRRLCEHCKRAYEPPEEVLQRLGIEPQAGVTIYRAVGCEKCEYTGYYGREGLYEVMPLSRRIRKMVVEERSEAEIRQVARQEGMKTLHEQGVKKVLDGITSLEEILSVPAEEE